MRDWGMEARRRGFDHERLEVYQLSLELVERIDRLVPGFTGAREHLGGQMHRAACSIPLNTAEGNGRYRRKDKAQFLVIATGSALECSAILDIADRLGVGTRQDREAIRALLQSIVRMLVALSRSIRNSTRQ